MSYCHSKCYRDDIEGTDVSNAGYALLLAMTSMIAPASESTDMECTERMEFLVGPRFDPTMTIFYVKRWTRNDNVWRFREGSSLILNC